MAHAAEHTRSLRRAKDVTLHGTLFPDLYYWRLVLFSSGGLFGAAICILFRHAPRRARRYAVVIHLLMGLYWGVVLTLDPHRMVAMAYPRTTWAKELEKWWLLYDPDLSSYRSGCGGYVIVGEQSCYINSFEPLLLLMMLCCMSVSGFYFRMPPLSFLLQVHLTIFTRIVMVGLYGSINSKASVDVQDSFGLYIAMLMLFFAVRRNDAQQRHTFYELHVLRREKDDNTERLTGEKERLRWELDMTRSTQGRVLRTRAVALAATQGTTTLGAAELGGNGPRGSESGGSSNGNAHDAATMDEVEDEEMTYGPAGQAGWWSTELTLCVLGRSSTTTTIGDDHISLWSERNEADFCDGMYRASFKWRVCITFSVAVLFIVMVVLDSCLTCLGSLALAVQFALIASQVVLHSMTDQRMARQLGHSSLLVLFTIFALGCVPIAFLAADESMPTWDGGQCSLQKISLQSLPIFNLVVGPCNVFITVMFVSMTVTATGFIVLICGLLLPEVAAYLIIALSLPRVTAAGEPLGFDHTAIFGVTVMVGSFFVGVTIGGFYVVLQRRASFTHAERRVEQLNVRVAALTREKERLNYERHLAQMHLAAASAELPIEVNASFVGKPADRSSSSYDVHNNGKAHAACTCASGKAPELPEGKAPELPEGSRHWGAGSPSFTSSAASSAELRGLEFSDAAHTSGRATAREFYDGGEAGAPPPPDAARGPVAAAPVLAAQPVLIQRTGATPSDAGTSNVSDLELRDISTRSEPLPEPPVPVLPAAAVRRRAPLPSKAPTRRRVRWQLLPSPSSPAASLSSSPAPQPHTSAVISAQPRDVGDLQSVEVDLREAHSMAKRALRGVRQRPNRPLGPLAQAGVLRPGARMPERLSHVSDASDKSAPCGSRTV